MNNFFFTFSRSCLHQACVLNFWLSTRSLLIFTNDSEQFLWQVLKEIKTLGNLCLQIKRHSTKWDLGKWFFLPLTWQSRCWAARWKPASPHRLPSSDSQSGRWTCWPLANRRRSCPWPKPRPKLWKRKNLQSEANKSVLGKAIRVYNVTNEN